MTLNHLTRPFEIKSLDEGGKITGYGSTFGNVDSDGDVIMPGAFAASIRRARETGKYPKMLWQHDTREIIGRWTHMEEDERGLKMEGHLILDVAKAREAYALAKAGVLDSLSIGFNIPEDGATRAGMGRIIREAALWEVSLVTFPANEMATLTASSSAGPSEIWSVTCGMRECPKRRLRRLQALQNRHLSKTGETLAKMCPRRMLQKQSPI